MDFETGPFSVAHCDSRWKVPVLFDLKFAGKTSEFDEFSPRLDAAGRAAGRWSYRWLGGGRGSRSEPRIGQFRPGIVSPDGTLGLEFEGNLI